MTWQLPVNQCLWNPDARHANSGFSEHNTFIITMQRLDLVALTAPCVGNIVVAFIRDNGMKGILFFPPQWGCHPRHDLKPESVIQIRLRRQAVTEDIFNLAERQSERRFLAQPEKFP